jgi:radical SAM superfamily enzyme YgiQ (UPF0313 family)
MVLSPDDARVGRRPSARGIPVLALRPIVGDRRIRLIFPSAHTSPARKVRHHAEFEVIGLTLPTLAALTPPGYDVAITNEMVSPIDFDEDVALVGITAKTSLAPRAYEIADTFRRRGVPVVLGGVHPTACPEEAGAHADAVAVGEAEHTWAQIVQDAVAGQLRPVYKSDKTVSLAGQPLPRRDLLDARSRGRKLLRPNFELLQTSRGCPYDCDFCTVTTFYGRAYRFRPVNEVVHEIQTLGSPVAIFQDDNIAGAPRRAKSLFRALEPLGIRWVGGINLRAADDPELVALMRSSGCILVYIGFESLTVDYAKNAGPGQDGTTVFRNMIAKLHDNGIMIQAGFIFGYDEDDPGIFDRTLEFATRTNIEVASFHILTPYPATPLYKRFVDQGRIIERNWSYYDGEHVVYRPMQMTPEALQENLFRCYREFYSLGSSMRRLAGSRTNLKMAVPMAAFFYIDNRRKAA